MGENKQPIMATLFAIVTLFFSPSTSLALENPSFFKGFTHMNEGRWDEAIMYFNISIKANPEYLPAYSHLALTYERKEDYPKAKETWREYAGFDSYFQKTVETHIELIDKFLQAREYLRDNQTGEALPLLEEIVATDKYPMSVIYLYTSKLLGEIYFQAKNYDEVIPLYEKVTLYYPRDVTEEIFFQYAYSYQQERDFEKALEVYKKLDERFSIKDRRKIKRYKNLVSLCYEGMGDDLFARDEHKKAKEIYEKILKSFPGTSNIPRVRQKEEKVEEKLAFLYKTEGDTAMLEEQYSQAGEFYQRIVDGCQKSSYYSYAGEAVGKLASLERQYLQQGSINYSKGEYEQALKSFQKLVELFPDSNHAAWAQLWVGLTYASLNQYSRSINELVKMVRRYPDSGWTPIAIERIGIYYWQKLGDKDKAIRTFGYIVRKYPDSLVTDNVLYYSGVIHLSKEKKDYRKAYINFMKLLKHFPESNLARRAKKGIIYIQKKVEDKKKTG